MERPRWSIWLTPALAIAVSVVYLGSEAYLFDGDLGFPLDDSWIHLEFARNLASGDGLSFNSGELATGSTAPLWTALLSILFVLPGSPVLWTKLLGVALFAVGGELVYRLCRELGLPVGLATLAAALTVLTDWLAWSALSGLEIPLFVVLSVGGVLLHLRERDADRPPASLAVLTLACLARPEGQLLLLLAFVDRLLLFDRDPGGALFWRRPPLRPVFQGLAVAAIVLAPMFLFNLMVGGSMLPTTFGAKVAPTQAAGLGAFLPSLRYLDRAPIAILFSAQPYMLLLAGAGLLALVGRLGTERDRGLLPGAWLVGMPLAYGVLSSLSGGTIAGNFGRYYFPLYPFVVIAGVLGLEYVSERLSGGLRVGSRRMPVRYALLVLLLAPNVAGVVRGAQRYVQTIANVHDSNVRAARWLAERLPPEAVVAVNDIGAFGYLLPNRILDLAGIVHPEARRLRFEAAAAGRPPDEGTLRFLGETRPDVLVIFPDWFPVLVGQGSPFTPIQSFEIPNNITMAGDEIVVYSTPWARVPVASNNG